MDRLWICQPSTVIRRFAWFYSKHFLCFFLLHKQPPKTDKLIVSLIVLVGVENLVFPRERDFNHAYDVCLVFHFIHFIVCACDACVRVFQIENICFSSRTVSRLSVELRENSKGSARALIVGVVASGERAARFCCFGVCNQATKKKRSTRRCLIDCNSLGSLPSGTTGRCMGIGAVARRGWRTTNAPFQRACRHPSGRPVSRNGIGRRALHEKGGMI